MKPIADSAPRPMYHSSLDWDVSDDLEEAQLHLSCAGTLIAALRDLHAAADEAHDGRVVDEALDRITAELLAALEAVDRMRMRRSL